MQDSQLGPKGVLYREFHCMRDSQLGPNGVLYREIPPYLSFSGMCHLTGPSTACVVCQLDWCCQFGGTLKFGLMVMGE